MILGEDKISLLLANTASLTPPGGIPANEAARRRAVQKSSILLKVRFNGKEVFCTDSRPLSTDFKLNFGLIFRIRIVQWPESLKVCQLHRLLQLRQPRASASGAVDSGLISTLVKPST